MRKVFDYAAEHFLKDLPICYALTVTTLPDGEEIYYISNPALGLWADRNRY